MIPMTPSSSAGYREHEGAGEEGTYWPSVSPGIPLSTSGDEGTGTKVRKPYTITKQRERWTEEEHQKFLEALKLYGRAWRRIEEHIGTKTAVQIRSHAQKFFSKIERDATAGAGVETGVEQVIDIPPPRPKRKPTHPYPRKAGRSFGKASEDECPLTAAGSFSSSSGISTANIAEACVKNNTREQDDPAEACDDVPKVPSDETKEVEREGFTRHWGDSRTSNRANMGQFPVRPASVAHYIVGASNARMPMQTTPEGLPLPVAAFQAGQWGRLFAGAYTPGMMQPQGMVMPWVGGPNAHAHAHEDGGAAMAATIAAASAWWAMQGGMLPGVMHPAMMHPAMGAMYLGAAPPLAIPTPYLFPHCPPQEVTVAAAPCADAEEILPTRVIGDDQELPSSNGSRLTSSAVRRAERALRVKELKARRTGSGNHLVSASSDICGSSWGGSGLNRFNSAGQVTVASLTSESPVASLSKGVSLPIKLNKVKHGLCGLVRKDREPHATGGSTDVGEEKRKRLRGGRSVSDSIHESDESAVGLRLSSEASARASGHFEKVRSVIGSNTLSGKFSKEDAVKIYDEKAAQTEVSCGSDASEDAGAAPADGNASGGGPSSNSSACGNVPRGNDGSGSSDGSSGGEGPSNVDKDQAAEKNGSSIDPEEAKRGEEKHARSTRQCLYSEFLPICKDGEKHEKYEAPLRLPRTVSLDGDQRKEVTERGQIAFQALFKRDTLPRTFSPPPSTALSSEKPADRSELPSKDGSSAKQSASLRHANRNLKVARNEGMDARSPDGTCADPDSAFNAWQPVKVSSSASKVDRCQSSMTMSSSRPTKSAEDECRRSLQQKERLLAVANNWLQLRTDTSSLDKDEIDEDAESGADDDCEMEQREDNFVCKLDLLERAQRGKLDYHVDGLATAGLDLSSKIEGNATWTAVASMSSTSSVKYSGLGFVPYQRASPSVEPSLKL